MNYYIIDNHVFRSPKKDIPLTLGYACLNDTCNKEIPVNKSCIQRTFEAKGVEYAIELAQRNLANVLRILKWNEEKGIRFYRLSSDMLPHCTNPKVTPKGQYYAYDLEVFRPICEKIGNYAKEHGHRLTYHPGQFCQIGTPNQNVFEKTCVDLKMHADMLDMMGLDQNSVMIIHGGGVYGDKPKTIKRWIKQFFQLPENVQSRIVIENCEKCYNFQDALELSRGVNRPVVFDTHHHDCYSILKENLPCPSTFLLEILDTWYKLGIKPKFHISEQDPDKRVGAHSKYVEVIPQYLIDLIKQGHEIDLMIEAKCKEKAVLHLYNKYGVYKNGRWFLN